MTDVLAIGDRLYSSWSLRGWLLFEQFEIAVTTRHATMRTPGFAEMLADFGAARTVPALKTGEAVLWDTLAIAETLAEQHPNAGHWPKDPAARALARTLVAEMHAGFTALRGAFPMNLARAYTGVDVTPDIQADVDRIQHLWRLARGHAGPGPWLFGAYSAVDAFYAPVAARLATYDVPLEQDAATYVAAHLALPAFRRWRAMGFAEGTRQAHYEFEHADRPWPGPASLPARAVDSTEALNPLCPYSGKPVAGDSLAEIDGMVIGFCNTFCRDKSVADAQAWPKLVALMDGLRPA